MGREGAGLCVSGVLARLCGSLWEKLKALTEVRREPPSLPLGALSVKKRA